VPEDSGILVGVTAPDENDPLTERIIGCAIEVHRVLGPGLLESAYAEALTVELADVGLSFQRQVPLPLPSVILCASVPQWRRYRHVR
jgi:hypothetical protein